jgi:Bax protein
MKYLQQFVILVIAVLPITLCAQWRPYQQQFVVKILPAVRQVNASIRTQRMHLLFLRQQSHLNHEQRAWLAKLANAYVIPHSPGVPWDQLVLRVDLVPASLALAQAINESNWGRSRFARVANNYFGMWCYQPGCGVVPRHRPQHRDYEVKRYSSLLDSVRDYVRNLNTQPAYQRFRLYRQQARQQGVRVTGLKMAAGLAAYSQRGQAYVDSIRKIIVGYNLQRFDG